MNYCHYTIHLKVISSISFSMKSAVLNKRMCAVSAIVLCVLMILFSSEAMNAALSGFDMWLCFVMPSIFPFFVCVSLMRESGILRIRGKGFKLPLFISSAVSGAPSGSRLCAHFGAENVISRDELSEYCGICNMVSPIFITGTLAAMAGTNAVVLPVLIGCYGAPLILLFLKKSRITNFNDISEKEERRPFFNVLCDAIGEGAFACVRICGVIIFFTVLLTMINIIADIFGIRTNNIVYILFLSLLEMTNGCSFLCMLDLSYPVLCGLFAFIIGFGGICIMAQSLAFADINVKKYLKTKLVVAVLSGMLSYCASLILPYSVETFSGGEALSGIANGTISLAVIALSSLIGCGIIWLRGVSRTRRS